MVVVEDGERPRLDEGQDHVDELRGGGVPPVVVLQAVEHLAADVDADELLGVVEAGLQQLGQVVVLRRADEAGDGDAGERARARVEVGQEDAERVPVELDYRELKQQQVAQMNKILLIRYLCLCQFSPVHLLRVSADA